MDPPLSLDSPSLTDQPVLSTLPATALQHPGFGTSQERLRPGNRATRVLAQILALGLYHSFSRTDVLPFTLYGVVTWGFNDVDAWVLWGSALRLARFFHAAAHGIDLTSAITQFIPIHLPIAALRDVGLTMPSLSFVLSYPENIFLRRRFPTPAAAIYAAETFCKWVDYHVLWLAECILRSSLKGLTTEWHFGIVLGMRKVDFIRQVVTSLAAGSEPYNFLQRLSGRLFNYHALDIEIVRLIRPWFTHVGVLQGRTQIAAALYPIEHSLSCPMDVVMNTGVDKMEEDSETVRAYHLLLTELD
ncbi:hypothetical protein B0H16DRAFT_1694332 [Mycena metata]|uniref:Uncharacterized protein n=1 Tax=Mycena metata TaxID=1033252 RepID=A0AAD7ID44_9AGAR|nr:hypothetical protein B0H16DRAFT_1694332 [Mycena metata]